MQKEWAFKDLGCRGVLYSVHAVFLFYIPFYLFPVYNNLTFIGSLFQILNVCIFLYTLVRAYAFLIYVNSIMVVNRFWLFHSVSSLTVQQSRIWLPPRSIPHEHPPHFTLPYLKVVANLPSLQTSSYVFSVGPCEIASFCMLHVSRSLQAALQNVSVSVPTSILEDQIVFGIIQFSNYCPSIECKLVSSCLNSQFSDS